jgi:hypothetical protein
MRADQPIDQLTALEKQHRRNTLNLKLAGGLRVVIDIQLCNAITSLCFSRKLFHDWTNHPAWPTPWRPTVQQDDAGTVQDLLRKILVGDNHWLSGICGMGRRGC